MLQSGLEIIKEENRLNGTGAGLISKNNSMKNLN